MAGMTRAIALVDLDDTLFQTRRKCPADVAEDRLTPLGFARDGSPLSFATPRQLGFVSWLAETTELVPVTARSLDALRRVRIPHRMAICAHGGVILDEAGEVDPEWAARMARADEAEELEALAAVIANEASRTGSAVRVRLLSEGGTPLYVLAKHQDGDADALNRVVDAVVGALPAGWTDHRNDNNIALLPPWLGKQNAVAHLLPRLRARFPDAPVIGIGDSLTDAPFMRICDFAMLPTHSQLARATLDAL
jgi:hydroxymethylpyrimidine pyrophosphatase-like HAD family hydrolase